MTASSAEATDEDSRGRIGDSREESEDGAGPDERFGDRELYTPPKLSHGLSAALGRPREWLFLVEDRMLIAGGISVAVFALLATVELLTSSHNSS